ncbi:uncharacterized protein LOC144655400 [Oculina patagonica]
MSDELENDQEGSKLDIKTDDAQKEVNVSIQLDKCENALTVVSTVSEMLDQGDVPSVITELSPEDSVLHGSSVLNETDTIASSSDLESSPCLSDTPVSADLLSDSTVINSTVGLLQQPVVLTSSVLPCVLTHVQGTSELLAGELQEREGQEELLMVKREDREVLEPCVVFTTSEAIQNSRASEKLSSSPATDVVVTAHPSSLTYLRQIFEQDQVTPQGQIVSVLPHGMTSPLSPTLPELHQCKWDNCCGHFLSLEDLVSHVNEYHIRTEASEYSCLWQGCARNGKGFNARYKMLIHMRTHTGERPHRCNHDSCGKSFSRLENLKIHTRSHTGERPYVCPVAGCNKRYSNSSDRYKHTRTHSETKPYACKVSNCFKRYTDPSSLRKHYKTIHGKDLIAEEQE